MLIGRLRHLPCIIVLLILMLFITACEIYRNVTPLDNVKGSWIGLGQTELSNEHINQREIPFFLTIAENGVVTGYVGDATIQRTGLMAPSWWFSIFTKEKYRMKFDLQGNIVNRERFRRDGGTLIINNVIDDELLCTFTSTGSRTDTQNLVMPVTNIKLRRPRD